MKLKLTPKLALVFFLFTLGMLIGVGIQIYRLGKAALETATVTELEASAVEKEASLDAWILEREANIAALANSPYLLGELANFTEAKSAPTAAHDRLVRELSVNTGAGQSFLTLFILSPENGQVILSTDPREEGEIRANRSYFTLGKAGSYTTPIYYSEYLQEPSITASAPLYSSAGQLMGVLVGRLNLDELESIIQRRSGLRQTDDAYLVNSSNLFVTQPRFLLDPAVLQRGVHTEPVQRCLAGGTGTMSALDYRDIPVITAYRWLPRRQMCLLVKVSQAEAMAPVREFVRAISWIAVGTLLLAALIAVILSRTLLRPIRAMQIAAQRYGRGDLDIRLRETGHDELGVLAHEFNRMAVSLREKELELLAYAQTLEQKVEERTRDLQESHSQLERAEEIGQVGSWEWFIPEDRIIASEGLVKLLGLRKKNFGATIASDFHHIHPDDVERMQKTIESSLQTKGPFELEGRVIRADGEVRTLYARGESFLDEQGQPLRLIGIAIDITERKQVEARINDLLMFNAGILNTAPIGILTYKISGECVFANENAASMIGTTVEGLISQNFRALESWKISGLYQLAEQAMQRKTPVTVDVHHLSTFGKEIWLTASALLFQSKDEERLLLTISDITDRKHAEEALQRITDDLRRSNAELEQFAYVASHDLQEPLRMISSYVQLLAKRYQGKLDSDADEFIAFAVDGAKRMQNLINDLLAYSRLGTRVQEFEPVSAEFLLEEAKTNLQLAVADHRASITHDVLPIVHGDSIQLVMLFQNLLGNAIKFHGTEMPRIHVSAQQEGGEWLFWVSDNGIGIDPKFAERIFDIFQRLNERSAYPGTGIGLAICKRIIQRHGGRIWVESQLGQGATFYFTLPALAIKQSMD